MYCHKNSQPDRRYALHVKAAAVCLFLFLSIVSGCSQTPEITGTLSPVSSTRLSVSTTRRTTAEVREPTPTTRPPLETTQPTLSPAPTTTRTVGTSTSGTTPESTPSATPTAPIATTPMTTATPPTAPSLSSGVLADVQTLCSFGSRRVGTAGNEAARVWITHSLEAMGYAVSTDTFTSTYPGNPQGTSLIVTIPGADSSRLLLIGAHYDTVEGVTGCEDNATGVAALLETARRLSGQTPVMEVRLVFFDSEEYGHSGSEHYAAQVAERTALMINLDCVGYGDFLYAYGPEGAGGAVRDFTLSRASSIGVALTTHTGNASWPAGTTGPWSDHAAFERRGVPFLYLEAANFAVETDAAWWGYTAEDPDVLHSALDRPDYLLPKYGARMERHMNDAAILSADLALHGFTTGSPSP